jgi:hypothetical protein
MRCAEAANLLSKLEPRSGEATVADLGAAERPLLTQVVERGWAAWIDAPEVDRGALGPVRAALAAARARRTAGEHGPALDLEEGRLREQVLRLSEKLARWEGSVALGTSEGGPYRDAAGADASLGRLALTVRGRALLADISPRLARVEDLPVEELEEDMRMLRRALSARAKRAAAILKLVSPAAPLVDEIHLRAAAVGLAVRREPVEHVARAFGAMMQGVLNSPLPDDKESVAAECAVVLTPGLDTLDASGTTSFILRAYSHLCTGGAASMTDAANAALIALALPQSEQERVVGQARALLAAMPPPFGAGAREIAPALHLVVAGLGAEPELPARLAETEAAVRALTGDDPQSFAAAALLLSARGADLAAALGRLSTLGRYLSRFSPTGLVVPAALLSLLDADPAEVLDDLRLAGAAIGEHKLALGGMENMSLAIKLLLEVGILATGAEGDPEEELDLAPRAVPALPAMGAVGLSVALPMAVAAVSTFHQTTIHRMAVSDFTYHPAHSHYVYG